MGHVGYSQWRYMRPARYVRSSPSFIFFHLLMTPLGHIGVPIAHRRLNAKAKHPRSSILPTVAAYWLQRTTEVWPPCQRPLTLPLPIVTQLSYHHVPEPGIHLVCTTVRQCAAGCVIEPQRSTYAFAIKSDLEDAGMGLVHLWLRSRWPTSLP